MRAAIVLSLLLPAFAPARAQSEEHCWVVSGQVTHQLGWVPRLAPPVGTPVSFRFTYRDGEPSMVNNVPYWPLSSAATTLSGVPLLFVDGAVEQFDSLAGRATVTLAFDDPSDPSYVPNPPPNTAHNRLWIHIPVSATASGASRTPVLSLPASDHFITSYRYMASSDPNAWLEDVFFASFTSMVPCVSRLELEAVGSANNVVPDESSAGNFRVYAERANPSAALENRVRVRAVPALACETVYFRRFDVGDPTGLFTGVPGDATGRQVLACDASMRVGDEQGDNQGAPSDCSIRGSETGEAIFEVSTLPGDNYRFAASCNLEVLKELRVEELGAPPPEVRVSPLLTVWRTVVVELRRMERVTDNFTLATIVNIDGDRVELSAPVPRRSYTDVLKGARAPTVVMPSRVRGHQVAIVDDDDFDLDGDLFGDNGAISCTASGDIVSENGSELPWPDVSLLATQLPRAFVTPQFVQLGSIPFKSHVSTGECEEIEGQRPAEARAILERNQAYSESRSPGHWVVSAITGYQADLCASGDPLTLFDDLIFGVTFTSFRGGASRGGSWVFVETLAEGKRLGHPKRLAKTTAHEVAHQFGACHPDGELLSSAIDSRSEVFSDATLRQIRSGGLDRSVTCD